MDDSYFCAAKVPKAPGGCDSPRTPANAFCRLTEVWVRTDAQARGALCAGMYGGETDAQARGALCAGIEWGGRCAAPGG